MRTPLARGTAFGAAALAVGAVVAPAAGGSSSLDFGTNDLPKVGNDAIPLGLSTIRIGATAGPAGGSQ
jgi:hypothetical protein